MTIQDDRRDARGGHEPTTGADQTGSGSGGTRGGEAGDHVRGPGGGRPVDDDPDRRAGTEDAPDGERQEGDEEAARTQLEHARRMASTPRPPRRTGVFLDPEDLRAHVGGLLRAILGGYEVDSFGNFTFAHDQARIVVTVGASPIGPQVGVFSVTNLDLDLTPPLAAFLLTTNHTLGFGSFSYDPANRAVWLRHSLLGTTLDLPELQATVAAIATTAARLDHPIQERFGGRRYDEAPDDVQRRMEPPETGQDAPPPPNVSGYL